MSLLIFASKLELHVRYFFQRHVNKRKRKAKHKLNQIELKGKLMKLSPDVKMCLKLILYP